MQLSIRFHQNLIRFGLPLLLLAILVLLAQSPLLHQYPEVLQIGITLDFAVTAPLVYLLLIWKRNIPKFTVVTFFIAALVLASYSIPAEHQFLLSQIKKWVLPAVELVVLGFVGFKVIELRKGFKAQKLASPDFYTAVRMAASEILPQKIVVFLAVEFSVFYYGFIHWKKRSLARHEFSYHKKSGTVAVLAVLIFITLIEVFVLHLLMERWSITFAWVLTVGSIYFGVQVFGMLRSLSKRPIAIEAASLELRFGIMSEASIPLAYIRAIELSTKPLVLNKQTCKLSPLGELESHNVLIYLKEEGILKGLYGKETPFTTIALYVDEKERFAQELKATLL